MVNKKYKEANKDIKVDELLKESTIEKMKNINYKEKESNLAFRLILIVSSIIIIGSSLFMKKNETESYAIGLPEYPTKIGFEDFDEKVKRREEIDENFIQNLNKFTIETSSQVLKDTDREANSLFSPISLYMALAMVAETAEGDTQEEIINALNMPDMDMIRGETGKLFRRLYFHNEIGRLNFANSLWLNKDIAFKENKLEALAKDYYAHSFSLDVHHSNSSKRISEWVSENTGGKLGNDPGDFPLDKDSRMTLINTVNFYDEWIDTFNKDKTKEDIFYLEDGSQVKNDFMNMTYASHGFAHGDGYTVSSLNMKNMNRMIFILPHEDKSPYDIISDPDRLKEAINALSSEKRGYGEVVFKIPKFDFSSKLGLNDLARKLGIENAFDESNANFTPLSDTKPLFISNIKQSTYISIDEIGVEASAFTQIDYCGSAMPEGRADMILDRP
ncbi:MAG TPA: serpin family protein, partial [Tissierellaceae bacterium]|nr:serpin family protein [Tissierellaceae bacterium]